MEDVQEKWVCGFWRRIGALFIDTLILGVFGYVLGIFLEDTFVQLGGWGKLIGFVISITYFGVMNSSLSGGQTIGKQLLNIRVVDASNATISVQKSFLRYSFIAVPFSLNGAQFTSDALLSYFIYPLSIIIFGGLFSIVYLYILNRATRQSLHDLVVGTYVVNAESSAEEMPPVWKPHFAIVAVLILGAGLLPVFTLGLAKSEPFKDLLATQEAIINIESVRYAGVEAGFSTVSSTETGSRTTTYVTAQAFLYQNNVGDSAFAEELAQIIIDTYPESKNKDLIQVTLSYGYDIGIASKWYNYNHQFNPQLLEGSE